MDEDCPQTLPIQGPAASSSVTEDMPCRPAPSVAQGASVATGMQRDASAPTDETASAVAASAASSSSVGAGETETNSSATKSAKRCKRTSASTAVVVTHEPLRDLPSKQLSMWDVAVAVPRPAPPQKPGATEQKARTQRQMTMLDLANAASAAPPQVPAPKKKAHRYSDAETAWILAEHEAQQGPNHIGGMAPKTWFDDLFNKGTDLQVLSGGSGSGIRSLVSRHVDNVRAEEAREAALLKRREDYRLKNLKRDA